MDTRGETLLVQRRGHRCCGCERGVHVDGRIGSTGSGRAPLRLKHQEVQRQQPRRQRQQGRWQRQQGQRGARTCTAVHRQHMTGRSRVNAVMVAVGVAMMAVVLLSSIDQSTANLEQQQQQQQQQQHDGRVVGETAVSGARLAPAPEHEQAAVRRAEGNTDMHMEPPVAVTMALAHDASDKQSVHQRQRRSHVDDAVRAAAPLGDHHQQRRQEEQTQGGARVRGRREEENCDNGKFTQTHVTAVAVASSFSTLIITVIVALLAKYFLRLKIKMDPHHIRIASQNQNLLYDPTDETQAAPAVMTSAPSI